MIGDAVAAGKRGNSYKAGPEFKQKNSKGRSYKHVEGRSSSDGGGGKETAKVAKSAHKTGPRPGVNVEDRQAPHKQRERKEVRYVNQGQIIDEWTRGKRGSYKA